MPGEKQRISCACLLVTEEQSVSGMNGGEAGVYCFKRKINKKEIPDTVAVASPAGGSCFPFDGGPLDVGRDKSVNALEEAMVKDKLIILAAQYQAGIDNPLAGDIYPYGTMAEVKQLLKLPDGTLRVLVEGICRVEIIKYLQTEPYYLVLAGRIEETQGKSPEDEALMRTVLPPFEEYVKKGKNIPRKCSRPYGISENPAGWLILSPPTSI